MYGAVVDDLFEITGDRVALRVHVQPAAGRTAVVGRHGDAVKVRVAAPPEGGRANEAVVALLAETFGVPADHVELTSGAKSRAKRFRIGPVELDEFRRQLERAMEDERPRGARTTP